MRFTTVASFLLASILAIGAVFGVQRWLNLERIQIKTDVERSMVRADVEKEPMATIVIADKSISFGEKIEPKILREIEWSSDVFPEGAFAKITDVITGQGVDQQRFALTQVSYGEPLLASKITVPGQRAKLSAVLSPDLKAVSIRVNDVLGVSGFVLPGDRVDVMITRGSGGNAYVDVLLQGLKVIAIDQLADDSRDKPSVVRTVTFEVSTAEAQKLVLGANVGTLSLALRNSGSGSIERIERVTTSDLDDEDAADDLVAVALEQQKTLEEERLNSLEAQLQALAELATQQDEKIDEIIVSDQTPVVQVAAPPISLLSAAPSKVGVGVIRNGSRVEYKVLTVSQAVDAEAKIGNNNDDVMINTDPEQENPSQ